VDNLICATHTLTGAAQITRKPTHKSFPKDIRCLRNDAQTILPVGDKGWNRDCDIVIPDYLAASPDSLTRQIAASALEARQGTPVFGYAAAGQRRQRTPRLRMVGVALVGVSILLGVTYACFNNPARTQGRGDVGARPKQATPCEGPSSKATAGADHPASR
jgi:hypothetical protein